MPENFHRLSMGPFLLWLVQITAPPVVSVITLGLVATAFGVEFDQFYVALSIVAALLCYIFIRPLIGQDLRTFSSGWSIVTHSALGWMGVTGILLLIGYATKVSAEYSRLVLFTWFLVNLPILAATLILLRQWLRRLLVRSGNTKTFVIAGVSPVSRQLLASVSDHPELGLEFKGYFDDRSAERLGKIDDSDLIGRLEDLPAYMKKERIDTLFIAIPLSDLDRTQTLINQLSDTTASIYFVPDIFFFTLIQARTDELAGIPVVAVCETPFNGISGVLKRGSDIIMASLMLMVALPGMAIIALMVKLTTPGSVIFKQTRYGLDGREIIVYKFRTMTVSEDGDVVPQAEKSDSRVTRVGAFLRRYSLDELPQLINVLQGRMSVVGPRPHAVAHNEKYRKLIKGYMVRHKVTPGITGLAQINGYRGETANVEDMERRIQYDLEYLRRWSLGLDLKIMLRTLAIWFRDEQAY